MSEESQGVSNAPDEVPSGEPAEKDVVSYESHAKLLKQLKAQKEKMANIEELQGKIDAMEAERRSEQEAEHAKKGNYQAIIEARDAENRELNEKIQSAITERDNATRTLQDSYKLNAFMNKLPGRLASNDYLSFVDLESIGMIDGDIDSESVDLAVSKFVESHSRLIEPTKMAKLPAGDTTSPTINSKPVGRSEIKSAMVDEFKKLY